MSKAQFKKKAQKRVEFLLKQRSRFGVLESEADLIAGASAVMGLINEMCFDSSHDDSMDIVPPAWFLLPMSGRSILEELKQ